MREYEESGSDPRENERRNRSLKLFAPRLCRERENERERGEREIESERRE